MAGEPSRTWSMRDSKKMCDSCFFFFFQAEDGIRDIGVTGVQTCALPISTSMIPEGAWALAVGKAVDKSGSATGRQGRRPSSERMSQAMALIDFTHFVNELATLSGKAILPFFRTAIPAEDKSRGGAFDPVTEADRARESAMRHLIKRTFPTHGIIGEEFGEERADAEYVWVLDPIDGTRAFIAGLPTWGTLIGLSHRGQPVRSEEHTSEL